MGKEARRIVDNIERLLHRKGNLVTKQRRLLTRLRTALEVEEQPTAKRKADEEITLSVGSIVDVKDRTSIWLNGVVRDVDHDAVYIHYLGWTKKYDEWIELDSQRLAPNGLYAKKR